MGEIINLDKLEEDATGLNSAGEVFLGLSQTGKLYGLVSEIATIIL